MNIDLNEFEKHLEYFDNLNTWELNDLTWTYNGKPVDVSQGEIDDFRYCGLANKEFAKVLLTTLKQDAADGASATEALHSGEPIHAWDDVKKDLGL